MNQHFTMSLILESDIIYSILPYVCIPTIGKLFCVNKFVNKLCNDKYFWKEKVEKDYKNMILKSDDWIIEYKHIYETHIRAGDCVDNFFSRITKCFQENTSVGATAYASPPIMTSINLDYFHWLHTLLLFGPGCQAQISNFNVNVETQVIRMDLIISYNKLMKETARLYLSYHEFKKYMANLYYYYNDDINMTYFNEWYDIHCLQR